MNHLYNYKEIEWCKPQIMNILQEIKKSNGDISEFLKGENIVKVMSRISNYIRYDIISKNETITYNVPVEINNEVQMLFD